MQHLRRSYERAALNREDLSTCPLEQFQRWFQEVESIERPDWLEINAMTLATLDRSTGQVFARIVLLKSATPTGFHFFTNYDSDKGRQLAGHPLASLVIYWPHLERQVRVQGSVSKTDRATSESYFQARPRNSQLSAAASQQSAPLIDRKLLEEEVRRLDELYKDQPVPCPENWGGFSLRPHEIEFWQGRPDRMHDRLVYRLSKQATNSSWSIERLAP